VILYGVYEIEDHDPADEDEGCIWPEGNAIVEVRRRDAEDEGDPREDGEWNVGHRVDNDNWRGGGGGADEGGQWRAAGDAVLFICRRGACALSVNKDTSDMSLRGNSPLWDDTSGI
jgi:hypothetical protein